MKNRILHPAVMLAAGLLLGVGSRLLDIYTQNLGNIFSQMAVWILMGTLIAVYSPTPRRAMANILPFCLGMLATYYAAAALTDGVYSRTVIAGWTAFAFCSPAKILMKIGVKCYNARTFPQNCGGQHFEAVRYQLNAKEA